MSARIIANCFRRVGFDNDGDELREEVQDDNELDTAINCLHRHVDIPKVVDAEMMVTVDKDVETSPE